MPPDPPASHPLRTLRRPEFEAGEPALRLVDLFAGCGGLTLGAAQAASRRGLATDVALAVDSDPAASAVYQANFPKAAFYSDHIETIFDGTLGQELSQTERSCMDKTGDIHFLLGGPPCQGHSDLNNHTRRSDPKNFLYLRMARAAEVLRPCLVLVENVPAVQHDKHSALGATRAHLESIGYQVSERVIRLDTLGVPQRRKRHILLAAASGWPSPESVLLRLDSLRCEARDLRWAIGDLAHIEHPTELDRAPRASAANIARMTYLLEKNIYDLPNDLRPPCHQDAHSYKSMYGRLRWTDPAQTITSGFSSIGQGRYMHPDQLRALTAHEAARIQGFPDYFSFTEAGRRTALSTMIGNAAPPQLSYSILSEVFSLASVDVLEDVHLSSVSH